MTTKQLLLGILLLLVIHCGSGPATTLTTSTQTVTIINYSFVPDTLTVRAGNTLFFLNQDNIPHRILSQSAPDRFDDTGVFDSLVIEAGETRLITIPAGTPSGTTLFFYDDVLKANMITPNGSIDVN